MRDPGRVKEPPIRRARDEIDEIGIYLEGGWLTLIYYDHQGPNTIEFPASMARPLSQSLQEAAEEIFKKAGLE